MTFRENTPMASEIEELQNDDNQTGTAIYGLA